MPASECELTVEGTTLCVRLAGDPEGFPVVFFHGTPGSRLDLAHGHDPEDLMAPPTHGYWLNAHLPRARLILRPGEGHLGIFEHLGEMLLALVGE